MRFEYRWVLCSQSRYENFVVYETLSYYGRYILSELQTYIESVNLKELEDRSPVAHTAFH